MSAACPRCQRPVSALGICSHCLLESDMPEIILGGTIELGDEIGSGGMGTVFRARHLRLDREVAVKFLAAELAKVEDFRKRFEREAKTLALLNHPNIVTIYDFGEEGGESFIVMELVEGRSLADLMPVTLPQAVDIAIQLCDALEYAHDKGVVHRDIKPPNIHVAGDGRVKVTDFGIARLLRAADLADPDLTLPGRALGTPQFMAPEALAGGAPDPRMDLYSVGVLLFLMLTDDYPWADIAGPEGRLGDVLRKALSPKLVERYQTAAELREDLRDAQRKAKLPGAETALLSRPTPAVLVPEERPRTNVAPHPSALYGRDPALGALRTMLQDSRLTTLVGPPGVGKSRLAWELANTLLAQEGREVWFCDLAKADDLAAICKALGRALDVPLMAGESASDTVEQLGSILAGRDNAVVVLDNMEHLVGLAPTSLGVWLQRARDLRVVVTSRARLRMPGETPFEVGALELPRAGAPAMDSPAVQLFVDRIRNLQTDYELGTTDAPMVVAIVERLEGLPLAIELAAARTRVLSLPQLLQRLEKHFDVLGGSARAPDKRQATLRGAIDWSWSLLDADEQQALAQLSVCRGGFSLEAAESILAPGMDAAPVLDLVQSLHDKSLVRSYAPEEFPGTVRFGLLESIREYAEEKLAEREETGLVQWRHTAYYLRACEAWSPGCDTHGGVFRVRQLALELDNILAVHRRSVQGGQAGLAMRAALAVGPVLWTRGPHPLYRGLLEEALALSTDTIDPLLEGRVRHMRARLVGLRGYETQVDLQRVLEIARKHGDQQLQCRVLSDLSSFDYQAGKLNSSRTYLAPALAIAHEIGDATTEGETLNRFGVVCRYQGQLEEALKHYKVARKVLREHGNLRVLGHVMHNEADVLHQQGRLGEAIGRYQEALKMHRLTGNRRVACTTTGNLASVLQESGEVDSARETYASAITQFRQVGDVRGEAVFTGALAILELETDRLEDARRGLERALAILPSNKEYEGLFRAYLGVTLGLLDQPGPADEQLQAAEAIFAGLDNQLRGEAVRLLRGRLDLARAEAGDGSPEKARAQAERLLERTETLTDRSDEVRAARRLLAAALG